MKLLFCPQCTDLIKLSFEQRTCACGKAWGWYYDDGRRATVHGTAVIVGIDNRTFGKAYRAMRDNSYLTKPAAMELGNFKAFVMHERYSPNVKRG